MQTFIIIAQYVIAIVIGTLVKEAWHFKNNQKKYSEGAIGPDDQVINWWKERWDDTLFSLLFGIVAAFILHAINLDIFLKKYASDFMGITSETATILAAMSSDIIMRKFNKKISK
jgi:hypothetical protein